MKEMADCRLCRYFKPIDDMGAEELEDIYVRANMIQVKVLEGSKNILGWCRKRKWIVTHYTGKCRFFTPKKVRRQKSLGEYVDV